MFRESVAEVGYESQLPILRGNSSDMEKGKHKNWGIVTGALRNYVSQIVCLSGFHSNSLDLHIRFLS